MNPKQMAKRLAELGRGDDTLLAHINAKEAAMLKAAGGSGKINPKTGIVEFDDGGNDGYTSQPSDPAPAPAPFNFTDTPAPQMSPVPPGFNTSPFDNLADKPAGFGQSSPAVSSFLNQDAFSGFDAADPFSAGNIPNSIIPDAPARTAVGNMEGLAQPGFSDYVTNFLKRFGLAKGSQLAFRALGIPGAAMSLFGPAKAAWDAPEGKGAEAFMRSLGIGASNQVLNGATGGAWGAFGGNVGDAVGKGTAPGSTGSSGSYSPGVDYARGALGLIGAARFANLGKPTTGQRAAEGQLNNLMANPSDVTKLPGFEAGKTAVERAAAGRGYLGSGNLTVALSKYGDQFYNNAVNTFSNVANANAGVRQNYQLNSTALALQSLGSLGYGYMRSRPQPTPELMGPPDLSGGAPNDLMNWEG